MIYIAIPYTGTKSQQQDRYEKVTAVTARMLMMGFTVYSPVTHWHPASLIVDLSHKHLMRDCLEKLVRSKHLLVIEEEGWEASMGVQMEILRAEKLDIPISVKTYGHLMVASVGDIL